MKWRGAVLAAVGWLCLSSPGAAEDGCPENSEAYKEERAGETVIVRCRCIAGYATFHQKCRAKPEIEAQLMERARHAAEGAKHTAEAIRSEAAVLGLTKLHDHAFLIITSAGASILARSPKLALSTLVAVLADIDTVLIDVASCSANDAVRTGCDNLRNFRKILAETETDLKRIQAP